MCLFFSFFSPVDNFIAGKRATTGGPEQSGGVVSEGSSGFSSEGVGPRGCGREVKGQGGEGDDVFSVFRDGLWNCSAFLLPNVQFTI